MVEIKLTGANWPDVLSQMKGILEGGAPGSGSTKPQKDASSGSAANNLNAGSTSTDKAITKEMVRAAWAEKKDAGVKREKITAIFGEYGVTKLDELPEEHYAAVHAKVLKLTV